MRLLRVLRCNSEPQITMHTLMILLVSCVNRDIQSKEMVLVSMIAEERLILTRILSLCDLMAIRSLSR